jgi:hypothetical protein
MTAKGNGSPNARRHSLAKLWGSPHPTCAAQFAEPSDDKKFLCAGAVRVTRSALRWAKMGLASRRLFC